MITLQPNEQRALLERFLRYVQVDTQSDEHSPTHPSTDKQKNLARVLVAEFKALGCADAAMAESGHVVATVPSNLPPDHPAAGRVPVLGPNAAEGATRRDDMRSSQR
jgi:tripeptide aminopeptidase